MLWFFSQVVSRWNIRMCCEWRWSYLLCELRRSGRGSPGLRQQWTLSLTPCPHTVIRWSSSLCEQRLSRESIQHASTDGDQPAAKTLTFHHGCIPDCSLQHWRVQIHTVWASEWSPSDRSERIGSFLNDSSNESTPRNRTSNRIERFGLIRVLCVEKKWPIHTHV